jgi:hypothetical protein
MNKSADPIEQRNPRKGYFFLGLFAVAGLILLALPADYFDTGQPMCVSVLLLNRECPGCGMTRAIQHLIHLDFKGAYFYNKISFVVFPLLVYMIIWEIRKRYFGKNGTSGDV